MKKFMLTLTALFMLTVSANAMGYEQARRQALFLTDKMAYELNLTEDQYEAAFEINLDYLLSVNDYNDLYGVYWTHRNLDFSYILLDWQYNAFCAATYFYRPLYWDAGYWHFGIYARYPHRDYFYYGYPRFYTVYRGGHSWRHNGGRSWYHGRDWGPHPGTHRDHHVGMRDGFQRGDYRNGFDNNHNNQGYRGRGFGSMSNRQGYSTGSQPRSGSYGGGSQQHRHSQSTDRSYGSRESSTRTTVTRPNSSVERHSGSGSGSFGNRGSRSYSSGSSTPSRSFSPSTTTPRSYNSTPSRSGSNSTYRGSGSTGSSRSGGSFGGSRSGGSSFGGSHSSGSSHSSGGSHSFGGRR